MKRGHHILTSHCLVRSLVWRCDWTLLLRKRRWNDCHRPFGALGTNGNRLFFAWYRRIWLGKYVISTRRCHMPQNSSEYGVIARESSCSCNFSSWRYQLATMIVRFDTIRLFFWGYAKDRVYADKSSTLEHFKTNLRQIITEISLNMCQKVVKKVTSKESMLATLRVEAILLL